jgi:hypothetical protein
MVPRHFSKWRAALAIFLLGSKSLVGNPEPQGLLLYQQPATSFTEAFEFRSFRQENALYASIVDTTGQRKQLKAGGVLAVLPYPPLSLDPDFESIARPAIARLESLERTYPTVQPQLEKARGKWERALSVFQQRAPVSAATPAAGPLATLSLKRGVFRDVHLTSATQGSATFRHATGVATIPLSELTPAQIVDLNRHSSSVQLPLGISRVFVPPTSKTGDLTSRVEAYGKRVVNFLSAKAGISPAVFSVWTFFVALPAAVVLLLLGILLSARRSRTGIKPAPGLRTS